MTPKGAKLIGAICILLILGTVWFQVAKGRIAAEEKETAEKQTTELAELRKSNRNLQESIKIARSAAASSGDSSAASLIPELPPSASRAERNRALLAMVNSGLIGELSYAAPSQYKITTKVAKLAEVLELTPGETETLQKAADNVLSNILTSARVQTGENSVTIETIDSPEARAALAQMRETFNSVLTGDGYALYEALGFRMALENSLSNVGLVPYTVTITKTVNPETGAANYSMVRKGTAPVTQIVNLGAAAKNGVPTNAPVTDEEAQRMTAARQAAQAKAEELQAARGSRAGVTPAAVGFAGPVGVGGRSGTRAVIANALGPVDALIPAGF